MPLDLSPPVPAIDVKAAVSAEEWEARVELAALYRLAARYGMTDLGGTHFSMRVPGPDHHFLINPFGLMFGEVSASNLVKIDVDGNIVLDNGFEGWCTVEQDCDPTLDVSPIDDARANREYLESIGFN